MDAVIYKICTEKAWVAARTSGAFAGSADDVRDGFVHLSSAEQLRGTADRHFAGQHNLVLLAIDAERLGVSLKWEPSRNGALFPHHYAPLPADAVLWSEALPLGEDGRHILPPRIG